MGTLFEADVISFDEFPAGLVAGADADAVPLRLISFLRTSFVIVSMGHGLPPTVSHSFCTFNMLFRCSSGYLVLSTNNKSCRSENV